MHASPAFPSSHAVAHRPGQARSRTLLGLALLALSLHAAFLGGVGGAVADRPPNAVALTAMIVRVVAPADVLEPAPVADAGGAVVLPQVPPPLRPGARLSTPGASLAAAAVGLAPSVVDEASGQPSVTAPVAMSGPEAVAASAYGSASASASAPASASASAPATFLAAGEMPPPTYPTLLPPSAVLHYEVRRGLLRGSGEIQWQRTGDDYALRLEARIAGLPLLTQVSQGSVDADGLAPTRFVDQRARRSAQAANFQREAGTVRFSGPGTVWPLLAGSQDQLSWMIQLAGIVAAAPERATDGGRIAMVIVGARGEASVRTLRFVGRENVETAAGSVPSLRFIVDGRATYDTSHEIWLDPAHDYLPARAIQRNAAGDAQVELLLERIEPSP